MDDVVTIRVRREAKNILRHLGTHSQDLLVKSVGVLSENLDKNLHGARSMQVHGDLDQRGEAGVHELLQTLNGSDFDELLA